MDPELRRDLLTLLRVPALAALMEALHDSLARHGEPKGSVAVDTRETSEALADLIGKVIAPGRKIRVAEVDRRLRENTRFHCSVQEAVELLRGAPVVVPREERRRKREAGERAVRRCFQLLPTLGLSPRAENRVVMWMRSESGERALRGGFRRWDEEALVKAVRAVALAFHRMPDRSQPPIYLADLANEVTDERSHGLDVGRPASSLLLRALAFFYPETAAREPHGSAAWRTNLLSEARIARDPISTRSDTFGLMGDTPYLRELRRAALTRSVNLDDLEQFGGDVRAFRGVALVSENPTVHSAMFKHVRANYLPEIHPTLICTNGNINLADWTLLEALVRSGAHVYYCGDFDAKGLDITRAILERFPDAASPWRMTASDYEAAIRNQAATLDPRSLQRAARHLPDLVHAMTARRIPADQEGLIPHLKADLDRFVLHGEPPPRRGAPGSGNTAFGEIVR
jgi:uncharacterized protein (TIGR02679 family)